MVLKIDALNVVSKREWQRVVVVCVRGVAEERSVNKGDFFEYTPWPNKNASILFGIIFQKLINKNEKLFHNNN